MIVARLTSRATALRILNVRPVESEPVDRKWPQRKTGNPLVREQSMTKPVRNVTKEYRLGEAAAKLDVVPAQPIDVGAYQMSAYAAGYARALMDVADGKVKPPKPDWRD